MKPSLIFIYGYPASGKTTYAKRLATHNPDVELISADAIREEVYGSQDSFGKPEDMYRIILDRMRAALMDGKRVVYDATNLRKDYRMDYLNELKDFDCRREIIRVNTPKNICISNHLNRNRDIPLDKLMPYFEINEPPTMDEGWDEINDYTYTAASKYFYLASPFFEGEARKNALEVAEHLRLEGHRVFVPMEHKVENAWDLPNYIWGQEVFKNDVKAINECDFVICLSYGRISSAGTNWEAGYAYGINKKVVVVEMDGVELMSIMLSNGSWSVLRGKEALYKYSWEVCEKLMDKEMEQK